MKINLPLYIELYRKTKPPKRYSINLNSYRNWSFIVSNIIKREYKQRVLESLVESYPDGFESFKYKKIKLVFTLFKASNRRIDRANVLSITEKFFCDAMVELGMIYDDNDDYIEETIYRSGGVDKLNPRVEVEIL